MNESQVIFSVEEDKTSKPRESGDSSGDEEETLVSDSKVTDSKKLGFRCGDKKYHCPAFVTSLHRKLLILLYVTLAAPVQFVTRIFLVTPIRVIVTMVYPNTGDHRLKSNQTNPNNLLVASFITGGILSLFIFTPLTHALQPHTSMVCTVYCGLITFVLGHLFVFMLVQEGITLATEYQYNKHNKILTYLFTQMRPAAYVGLFSGLIMSFSEVIVRSRFTAPYLLPEQYNSLAQQPFLDWCRPTEDIPLVYILIFILIATLIRGHVVFTKV
jgi:hypothetical protein